jgi:hypothetical protein
MSTIDERSAAIEAKEEGKAKAKATRLTKAEKQAASKAAIEQAKERIAKARVAE